jgi:hypothetical protein
MIPEAQKGVVMVDGSVTDIGSRIPDPAIATKEEGKKFVVPFFKPQI